MPAYCIYPNGERARSQSGVRAAVVNAADAAAARVRANQLRTLGSDPDFTDQVYGVAQLSATTSDVEFLIDGSPLAFGVTRRGA